MPYVRDVPSPLWLVCGALFGFGIVGFFTGLLLIPFGIALLRHLIRRRAAGWWLMVVGLGLGPIVLFWGDVVGHPDGDCIVYARGFECRASAAVPAFTVGVLLCAIGLLLGIATTFRARSRPDVSHV